LALASPSHSSTKRESYSFATGVLDPDIDRAGLRDRPAGLDGHPRSVFLLPSYPKVIEGDVLSLSFLQAPQSAGTVGTHLERRTIHRPRFHFSDPILRYHAG
jgi:hypothetical protein